MRLVGSHVDTEPSPVLPSGPAAAALLAAGLGCAMLGFLSMVAENPRVSKALAWYSPSGALSGESGGAILVWLLTWWVLSMRWKSRQISLKVSVLSALVLLALGVLLTVPGKLLGL